MNAPRYLELEIVSSSETREELGVFCASFHPLYCPSGTRRCEDAVGSYVLEFNDNCIWILQLNSFFCAGGAYSSDFWLYIYIHPPSAPGNPYPGHYWLRALVQIRRSSVCVDCDYYADLGVDEPDCNDLGELTLTPQPISTGLLPCNDLTTWVVKVRNVL